MKRFLKTIKLIICLIMMLMLILDSKTAISGGIKGIDLCIRSAIPALLPAMLLADIMTQTMLATSKNHISILSKIFGTPSGSEGIIISGFLCGYPVGAKLTGEQYNAGMLSKENAERILSFSNNAGPAFVFGICGNLFTDQKTVLILWAIQILSAYITSLFHKNQCSSTEIVTQKSEKTIADAVGKCVKTMGIVCGWIVTFRVIIEFLQKWVLWILPQVVSASIIGLLELTNGCCLLNCVSSETLRFILCSALLSSGGLCVLLQTIAVTKPLKINCYIKGKLIQTIFSILLSSMLLIIANNTASQLSKYIILMILLCSILLGIIFKKICSISKKNDI